jgi:hypothetical protein
VGNDEIKREIVAAQEIISRMAPGWLEVQELDSQCQVINQAGFTCPVPLVVASGVTRADAEGLVFCRNLLPQLLAKIAEAL